MTRINVGIPVKLLSDKHLLSEHREIKRIPNHLAKHGIKCLKNAPKEFKLGTGHFLFFIPYGMYTFTRYIDIHIECIYRGLNVQDYSSAWDIYQKIPLYKMWHPSKLDTLLIIERLQKRDPVFYKDLEKKLTRTPFSKPSC